MPNLSEEVVPSFYAANWPDGLKGKDLRPRLVDSFKVKYLVDSGSMTCVVPPEPGDKVDPSIRLQAVDGSPFPAYGRRDIKVKLGRKVYEITAVIAKVQAPILRWDFIRKYKFDWIWGEFGDLYLRDKKAKIAKKIGACCNTSQVTTASRSCPEWGHAHFLGGVFENLR